MTKRTRNGIFYLLVAVFFILGGAAVLYAQGWRLKVAFPSGPDNELNLVAWNKVGGMYIRTFPENAKLIINGKAIKRPGGLFEKGTLLNNIFPGEYRVRIEEAGYKPWQADLPIRPAFVLSRSRIVLVPETSNAATTSPMRDVEIFGNRLALTSINGTTTFNGRPVMGDRILNGSEDGERLLTLSTKDGAFYWNDLQTGTSTLVSRTMPRLGLNFRTASTTRIIPIPQNGVSFAVMSPSALRLANTATGGVTILEENASMASAAASPTRIAWTTFSKKDGRSIISFYDLLSNTFIRQADFAPGRTVEMAFVDRNTLLLLQDSGSLYLLSLSNSNREELARNVRSFVLAPDASAVAILENDGVSVLGFQSSEEYSFFRVPESGKIKELIWYKDRAHLFAVYGDHTAFLDFADHSLANFVDVAGTGEVEYSPADNTLYALVGQDLLSFRFPD